MLIIFDFDGTLMKASWKGLFEAYKTVIKSQGENYKDLFQNLNEFKKWWSPDWRENNRKLGIKGLGEANRANRIFYEIYNFHTYLFPWTGKVIKELSHNHRLALLTNRHRESAEKILGSLKNYFSVIVGAEDINLLKPNPEGIRVILIREAYADPIDTLVIGDMPDDIMVGKSVGVKTGVVKWGLGDWEELLSFNPDYAFERYKDLLEI